MIPFRSLSHDEWVRTRRSHSKVTYVITVGGGVVFFVTFVPTM